MSTFLAPIEASILFCLKLSLDNARGDKKDTAESGK